MHLSSPDNTYPRFNIVIGNMSYENLFPLLPYSLRTVFIWSFPGLYKYLQYALIIRLCVFWKITVFLKMGVIDVDECSCEYIRFY